MRINLLTSLAVLIIVLAVALATQTYRADRFKEQRNQEREDKDRAIDFANDKQEETKIYYNAFSNQVAKTKVIEMSLQNLEALRNSDRLRFLTQFDGLRRDLKNLESSISIEALLDSIPFRVVNLPCDDSVRVFQYQLIDEFNTISALVLDSPQFEIKVPIKSTVYWQRKNKFMWWRIGKKEWFIESYSPNKLVDITKQELIKVYKR